MLLHWLYRRIFWNHYTGAIMWETLAYKRPNVWKVGERQEKSAEQFSFSPLKRLLAKNKHLYWSKAFRKILSSKINLTTFLSSISIQVSFEWSWWMTYHYIIIHILKIARPCYVHIYIASYMYICIYIIKHNSGWKLTLHICFKIKM